MENENRRQTECVRYDKVWQRVSPQLNPYPQVRSAAQAIADAVGDKLSVDCIMPYSFDKSAHEAVAEAVRKAARDTGVARI